ncbi:alpha/beta-hydrolase [Trametes gibbosa]|nr:alpha/beta-hydrolase [Trametes gibbosa]
MVPPSSGATLRICTMTSFALLSLLPLVYLTGLVRATRAYNSSSGAVSNSSDVVFFEVPLDYHNVSAGRGQLALAKVNATGERRGTLFLNPGGPGNSGIAQLGVSSDLLVSLTGGFYDIVSWDPRGIGALTVPGEIFCFDSVEEYDSFWNGTVELTGIEEEGNFTDPADIDALLAQAPIMQAKYDELAQRCLRHPSGKYLKYVGSAAAARDLVALADALDGPGSPINFAGVSYGTVIGSWLVNMFPERVGRVLLDGVVDTPLLATEETPIIWARHELADSDKVYEAFLTGCALAGPESCLIATGSNQTAADIDAVVQTLIVEAHDAARKNASVPVTSASIRQALQEVITVPSQSANFANTTWPQLVAEVQAESGESSTDRGVLYRRARRGHTAQQNPTRSYSDMAILCGDSVDLRGTNMSKVFKEVISASHNPSKMFSSVWPALYYSCPFWPVRAVERYQGPFNKTLASKVMVVSNTFDPATPVSGAQHVAFLLGESATLVRQNAFGHTSIAAPSQCLNALMFAYFTNNTLPENNQTICEVDQDFELFPGVNTEAILAVMST